MCLKNILNIAFYNETNKIKHGVEDENCFFLFKYDRDVVI